jgi:hypothetical protein
LSVENNTGSGMKLRGRRLALAVTMAVLTLLPAACGSGSSGGASGDPGKQERSSGTGERGATGGAGEATAERTKETGSGEAAELARAEVGKREITNMLPADGEGPDPARPLPENPPQGIEVYPPTTNRTVKGPIDYHRKPPTNGNHAPLWQNCGYYPEPIQDRHAVHSMDHGVVWITYRPDLPQKQLETLRSYANENYVIVSPYPGQNAPVIATSWRVQLDLDGADDPRLDQFVDEFKVSELAPLSGNRCVLGVGDPAG